MDEFENYETEFNFALNSINRKIKNLSQHFGGKLLSFLLFL